MGVPLQLHSDQGRNFVSAVLKGVCELLGIDKTKTTPLHPQSDGMVERFNRTILNNLSLMVSKNQQDWDQKVPLFLLAYRSAVHETTGYSSSQMLAAEDLRLPCDCCLVALRIHLHRLRVRCRISGTLICRHCSRVETKYDYAIRQITTSTATPPDPWSDEKVREDQMADPDIKPLIEFMESSSNKPSWQDISAYDPYN
ncbi:retrovirus-related Pol polyprotein from transposon 412 [Trichonephila clavipes]|nr:retrovirus-related Pol polyprotein from transposon 412 [Trichonephila clavipes]